MIGGSKNQKLSTSAFDVRPAAIVSRNQFKFEWTSSGPKPSPAESSRFLLHPITRSPDSYAGIPRGFTLARMKVTIWSIEVPGPKMPVTPC